MTAEMERLLDGLPGTDWNVFLRRRRSTVSAMQNRLVVKTGLDMLAVMIRELFIAAAITGAAVGLAPVVAADNGHYDGDVPGMNYDASLGAPCDNYERFIFGRGPGGQAEACHFITNQYPAAQSGYWVITYPLNGVQQVGAPCQNPRGSAAQTPDGLPMLCTEHGWQVGQLTGGGFPIVGGGFPSDTGVTG